MAALRIRNNWQEDLSLKEALNEFVRQGLRRDEILDYMVRDFPDYAWSIRTLDRRLRYFEIFYTDVDVTVEQVEQVVRQELEGPGNMLGYRAMQKKIRQVHDIRVPRDLVHAVMYDIDPEGLEQRIPGLKRKKRKGHFTTRGPNWVLSLDGHDKLMGYQNNTFPIAVYGCIDTCSRKVLWAKVWTSNSNPKLIARFYLEHLYKTKTISSMIRVDKGTETVEMVTMHAYLRQQHQDMDPNETVIYGPSTANQVQRIYDCTDSNIVQLFKHLFFCFSLIPYR